MKKLTQKGFVVQLLIIIIAILVIGGGFYIYKNNKAEAPIVPENNLEILGNKEDLVSFSIKPGDRVSGVLNLEGIVKGGYFFEANIGIILLDENKNVLKDGYGTATTNWMTADPVSFTATIDATGLSGNGYIAIREDDPSGGEAGIPSEILIPVIFQP